MLLLFFLFAAELAKEEGMVPLPSRWAGLRRRGLWDSGAVLGGLDLMLFLS